jgi:AraC-like DNA-binding protein
VLDPPPEDFRLLRFRSDDYPASHRLAAWQHIMAQKLLKVHIEPLPGPPFHVDASLRILEGVRFGTSSFSASFFRRTREIADADNEDFVLIINMEGTLTVSEPKGEVVLGEGDAYFMNCREEKNFIRPVTGKLLGVRFSRDALMDVLPNVGNSTSGMIPKGEAALRLLTVYLKELDDNQRLSDPALRKLVVKQIYEIAVLCLSPLCAAPKVQRGAAALKLQAIKDFIDKDLKKQKLSIVDVAAAHGLSERQVQRLFEAEETTFSAYLLEKRLESVFLALKDLRRVHLSIGEIATGCGFSDLSYFNRAFRKRYLVSPSEVRSNSGRATPANAL